MAWAYAVETTPPLPPVHGDHGQPVPVSKSSIVVPPLLLPPPPVPSSNQLMFLPMTVCQSVVQVTDPENR